MASSQHHPSYVAVNKSVTIGFAYPFDRFSSLKLYFFLKSPCCSSPTSIADHSILYYLQEDDSLTSEDIVGHLNLNTKPSQLRLTRSSRDLVLEFTATEP